MAHFSVVLVKSQLPWQPSTLILFLQSCVITKSSAQVLGFIVATLCLTSLPFSHDLFKLENFSRACQAHLSEFSLVYSLGHLSLECLDTAHSTFYTVLFTQYLGFFNPIFSSYFSQMNSATNQSVIAGSNFVTYFLLINIFIPDVCLFRITTLGSYKDLRDTLTSFCSRDSKGPVIGRPTQGHTAH